MSKEEFVVECAMRNLSSMFAGDRYMHDVYKVGHEYAFESAKKLADLIYGKDDDTLA